MKAFVCRAVQVNGYPKWEVQVADDGGDYAAVAPLRFYDSETDCEAERDRLDHAENGKP
jgi:hypothetical protein